VAGTETEAETVDIVWSQGSSCLPGVCPGMCKVIGLVHILHMHVCMYVCMYIYTYSHLLVFECQRSTLTFLKAWAALAVDGVDLGLVMGLGLEFFRAVHILVGWVLRIRLILPANN